MVDLVKIHEDRVGISESTSAVITLTFDFYDPLYIGGNITNDNNGINFTPDTSDPKRITGFTIKVKDPDQQKVKNQIKLGDMTVNYLSAKAGVAVGSKRPKIETQAGNTPQLPNAPLQPQVFNLDASKLPCLFSGDLLLIKKLDNYQFGMAALEDNDPEEAVPKLHQVIEESGDKDDEYYKPLRHACSHIVLDNANAVKALNQRFNIQCNVDEPVDFTDPNNWRQLYIYAHALKQVADNHIKKILK